MNIIFASYGNDSIALIRWAHEQQKKDVVIAYSDTGWSADWWGERVDAAEDWAKSLGFSPVRIKSEGMEDLVRRRKAWPRGGGGRFQFCTSQLKMEPALRWMDEVDPEKDAVCHIGIRREESRNRATFPEWTEESERHGGRSLHAPLVRLSAEERNDILARTPFEPLPTRSKECWPCVNATKREIKLLEPARIERIHQLEVEMGINKKGNARVMFSPKRNGGVGIHAVVKDASKGTDDIFSTACDGGWCGA